MTEPTRDERLAALRAQRAADAPPSGAAAVGSAVGASTGRLARPRKPSGARVVAAGTSVVSFAAMVAAMGPVLAQPETESGIGDEGGSRSTPGVDPAVGLATDPAAETAAVQPNVIVEVIPFYVDANGDPVDSASIPADAVVADGAAAEVGRDHVVTVEGAPTQPVAPPPTQAAPPNSPAPTAAPTQPVPAPTAAPAPPSTVAPTTTPPPAPTTAPTTAPPPAPTTAPPPPRSEASG